MNERPKERSTPQLDSYLDRFLNKWRRVLTNGKNRDLVKILPNWEVATSELGSNAYDARYARARPLLPYREVSATDNGNRRAIMETAGQ